MSINKHITLPLLFLAVCFLLNIPSNAQGLTQGNEFSDREAQIRILEYQIKIQEMEYEAKKRNEEIQRLRAESSSIQHNNESVGSAFQLSGMTRQAEQEKIAKDTAFAAVSASVAAFEASQMRRDMELNAVKTRNSIYVVTALLIGVMLVIFVIKKVKKESFMRDNEKFGLFVIILSALASLLALVISSNWNDQFDLLQNLMSHLDVEFIENSDGDGHVIDVPTKYIILVCAFVAAYGLTILLGILHAPIRILLRFNKLSSKQD